MKPGVLFRQHQSVLFRTEQAHIEQITSTLALNSGQNLDMAAGPLGAKPRHAAAQYDPLAFSQLKISTLLYGVGLIAADELFPES